MIRGSDGTHNTQHTPITIAEFSRRTETEGGSALQAEHTRFARVKSSEFVPKLIGLVYLCRDDFSTHSRCHLRMKSLDHV